MVTQVTTGEWITVPYGPDHRREQEALIGVEFDPKGGKHGSDWYAMGRAVPWLRTPAGYGLCGKYLEVFKVPDGRLLAQAWDKYGTYSRFRFFADAAEFNAWAESLGPETDPETGRPFRR